MELSLVTVLVISYNSRDTILETLESVKAQTYGNLELVVADDASKDDTVAIVENWIQENDGRFARIKLIANEKNKGIPGNLNGALPEVQGKYVKILAADDIMMPEAIVSYIKFMNNTEKQLPIGKVALFGTGDIDFSSIETYISRCNSYTKLPWKEQYKLLLKQNWVVAPAGSFYPTKLVNKLQGYDERFSTMEDYPINLKTMAEGWAFGLIDAPVIRYRISGQSITGSRREALRKTERKLFWKVRFWKMLQIGMFREALGQARSWLV